MHKHILYQIKQMHIERQGEGESSEISEIVQQHQKKHMDRFFSPKIINCVTVF